ncbi:thiol:disulfide interchange protein DsbC [Plasticicumulans lactativorans]|uniref:Thiol:disulfide interchange protein n=1 Tax=Plasticicumulans lactativorans TaxID=1133106 RepID=A0A4R2L1P9_9GAMM|nr:DsbC family protein [Plasticicumulans lactativorans]TCO80213.1 thiol:disulfide interchange protein DsbC [Plasticicumulans lactativorans]
MRVLMGVVLTLGVAAAVAAEGPRPDLGRLQAVLDGHKPDSVSPGPLPGLFEVVVGGRVLYLSADGRYVVRGDVIDLAKGVNLTEERGNALRLAALATVPESEMVIFAPSGPVRHTVTVFTDIDCGYCRKLHSEIEAYNRYGIRVRYLAYPRTGLDGESYHKFVSVWCSADRKDALTRAKRGEELPAADCPSPIAAQYELGNRLGVQGTPAMVLETGEMVPGYVPAARLAMMLDAPPARP